MRVTHSRPALRDVSGEKASALGRDRLNRDDLAPAHSLCILYRKTKDERYLKLALQIVDEFAATENGEPLAATTCGAHLMAKSFSRLPNRGGKAYTQSWRCRNSTGLPVKTATGEPLNESGGALSSLIGTTTAVFVGRAGNRNPYHLAAIESCCTIAWTAMRRRDAETHRESHCRR